jgi:muconolactone D-isomerase
VEFLVLVQVNFPPDMPVDRRGAIAEQEVERGRELRRQGTILRIWRIPGRQANVGIWVADSADDLHSKIASLPAFPWLDVVVTPLATHPLEAGA